MGSMGKDEQLTLMMGKVVSEKRRARGMEMRGRVRREKWSGGSCWRYGL